MKTAMQQLISTFHLYQNSGCSLEEHELLSFYIKSAEDLLEKEKEQIIEAYGTAIIMFYESEQPEEYYNKTYSQNK